MPALKWLTRTQIKTIVRDALGRVGDLSSQVDIEAITFTDWTTHHVRVFSISIVDGMMRKGYDVFLTIEKMTRFANVGEVIDYVTEEQTIRQEKLEDAF